MADLSWPWVLCGSLGRFGNTPLMPAPISRNCVGSGQLSLIFPESALLMNSPSYTFQISLERIGFGEVLSPFNHHVNWGQGQEKEYDLERAAPRKMEAFSSFVGATLS